MALTAITLNREVGNGKYADVIDIAEILASGELGTPANAIAVCVRESPRGKAVQQGKSAGESSEVN